MGEHRTHKGRAALLYAQEHPGRPITIDEIADAIGWTTSATSSALSRALQAYPKHLVRVPNRRGVYIWYATSGDHDDAQRASDVGSSQPTTTTTTTMTTTTGKPQTRASTENALPNDDEFILKVIARKDGALLVQDPDTQSIYKLTPFKF